MRNSMCAPCFDLAGDILGKSAKCLTKPFFSAVDICENINNCGLYFCGFRDPIQQKIIWPYFGSQKITSL